MEPWLLRAPVDHSHGGGPCACARQTAACTHERQAQQAVAAGDVLLRDERARRRDPEAATPGTWIAEPPVVVACNCEPEDV